MKHYHFAKKADSDMESIWYYGAINWGADQANAYDGAITAACADLANGKKQGRPVEGREGRFKYRVGSHFVVFRHVEDGIVVVRVLHAAMEMQKHLPEG